MSEGSQETGRESLVPGIVQDARTGRVLMLGYLNQEAVELTRQTGYVHFWSRSRRQMWKKGDTSGNTLRLVDMTSDCDGDTWLIRADPDGPTCHTGEVSCFDGAAAPSRFTQEDLLAPAGGGSALDRLWHTVQQRKTQRPDGSYTVRLIDGGPDLTGRKVLEEAGEVLMATKDHATGAADDQRVAEEAADLLYHLLVLLAERDIALPTVFDILEQRSR